MLKICVCESKKSSSRLFKRHQYYFLSSDVRAHYIADIKDEGCQEQRESMDVRVHFLTQLHCDYQSKCRGINICCTEYKKIRYLSFVQDLNPKIKAFVC